MKNYVLICDSSHISFPVKASLHFIRDTLVTTRYPSPPMSTWTSSVTRGRFPQAYYRKNSAKTWLNMPRLACFLLVTARTAHLRVAASIRQRSSSGKQHLGRSRVEFSTPRARKNARPWGNSKRSCSGRQLQLMIY